MRSLQRILLERRTRRFLDEMIHKYADIRLSARTKGEMSRKRRRGEATGVLKSTNGCSEMAQRYGDQGEHSTSSSCRTESEQSSRLSSSALLDSERQSRKGRERQQQEQQDEYRWRMSDARTVSEYGSAFSSTRLTSLLEEEDVDNNAQSSQVGSRRGSDSSSTASTVRETEENLEHCCGSSECESSSTLVESAPTSTSTQPTDDNQAEDQSEMSGSQADSPPPTSSTETLPRLRPTPPEHRVVPNCCDFFPSPHPHYAKEVIGGGKCEGATSNTPSPTNDTSPDAQPTNQDAESADSSSTTTNSNGNSGPSENSRARHESNDDFEMWDYICPQHARRNYANEWF